MAGIISSTEYHAFAVFTFSATTYYIGTQSELRGGNWYDPAIMAPPQLAMSFGDELSVMQAQNIDLVLGDGATGTYRALAVNNILDGTQIVVTLVMRQHWSDGSTTEQTYAQQLTVCGVTLQPGQVTLHLQDIEEQRLQALYPLNTWQGSDWSDLSSDDAGKPICEPVGTAIKLPSVLLRSDVAGALYWYGLCAGTPKLIGISSINSGTKTITMTAPPALALLAGMVIFISGSTAADGRYTVASAAGTTIVVNETLPASTGGSVQFMPQPLTVYRNKRVVSSSEYLVQCIVASSALANTNFAAGTLPPWTSTILGAGSVTTTVGNCAISGTDASNYGNISQTITGLIRQCRIAVVITLGAGADATVYGSAIQGINTVSAPAGATTTLIIPVAGTSGSSTLQIAPYNYAGTTNVKSIRIVNLNLSILRFLVPQIDFNGGAYTIEADCCGVESPNASTEISRLLTIVGGTTDATTFNAAAAASFSQLVDCDYGRSGQRTILSIIDDLLVVARAGISRDANGAYTIWQDIAGSPVLTLDESAGDLVQVDSFASASQPSSVSISYAPSSADAGQMQVNPLSRAVTGGILAAAQPREIRYLRDGTTADQLICYKALRSWRNREATATIYQQQVNIGNIIALTSPTNWPGQKQFTVWDIQRVQSGNQLTLREYDAAVYTYTAGTLPASAPTGYQPDYSFTSPAAPTAVAVTATAARVANDGTTTSYATVQATPPTLNWEQIWFAAIHNVTGEITLALGGSIGGGNYGCSLGPLRPGEVYQLQVYAVNNNSVQGVVQNTFNATAIGGGGAVTTFTAAGQTILPATVSSITATQVLGNNVTVTWAAIAGTNVATYSLEKSTGSGFSVIYTGNATSYTDTNINYSPTATVTYRVRAQDTYGNFSAAYATAAGLHVTANIGGGLGGDLKNTTVATSNRTAQTTVSSSWTNGTIGSPSVYGSLILSHSLGVIPICGSVSSGASNAGACLWAVSTTQIKVVIFAFYDAGAPLGTATTSSTTVSSTPSSHTHTFPFSTGSGTFAVTIW